MLEKEIKRQIIDYLKHRGYLTIRTNAGKVYHRTGWIQLADKNTADIVACSPKGRFCAFEIKKSDGVITQGQIDFLYDVNRRGGVAAIIRSIDDLRQVLKESSVNKRRGTI